MSWKCFLISNGTPCADDDVVVGMGGIDGFAGSESVCVCVCGCLSDWLQGCKVDPVGHAQCGKS